MSLAWWGTTRRAGSTANRSKTSRAPREHYCAQGRTDAPGPSYAHGTLRAARRAAGASHAGAEPRTRRSSSGAAPGKHAGAGGSRIRGEAARWNRRGRACQDVVGRARRDGHAIAGGRAGADTRWREGAASGRGRDAEVTGRAPDRAPPRGAGARPRRGHCVGRGREPRRAKEGEGGGGEEGEVSPRARTKRRMAVRLRAATGEPGGGRGGENVREGGGG
jgi:hypothetical protein